MSRTWMDMPERYGLVSRLLHWSMAYLLIWQFLTIFLWGYFGDTEMVRTITFFGPYHRTVGLLVIVLVIFRAVWALVNRNNRPPHDRGWVGRIALTVHVIFYAFMFLIPALALLRSYGSGKGWISWGIPIVPETGVEVGWMVALADALHGELSWVLLALIAGHVVMAIAHQIVLRDRTLSRMAGPIRNAG